jgi:hypothetical protein
MAETTGGEGDVAPRMGGRVTCVHARRCVGFGDFWE